MQEVYVLEITTRCPRNCPYCFTRKTGEDMDIETMLKTLEFLKSRDIFAVAFFGGEPLLRVDIVKFFLKNADYKWVLCTGAPTNLYHVLDMPVILYLSHNGKYNNEMRPGSGAKYALVLGVINEHRNPVSLRLTYPRNCDPDWYLKSVLDMLGRVKRKVEVALGIDKYAVIQRDDQYLQDYLTVAEGICQFMEKEQIGRFSICCSRAGITSSAGLDMCFSGAGFYYIDAKGQIYPCFMDRWSGAEPIGTVTEGYRYQYLPTRLPDKIGTTGHLYCRCPWTRLVMSEGVSRYCPDPWLCRFTQEIDRLLSQYQVVSSMIPPTARETVVCG